MRKHYYLILLLMTLLGWQAEVAGQYCASGASYTGDSKIDQVVLAGSTVTLNNNTVINGCETYTDHTLLAPPDLLPGQTYTVAVTLGTCSGDYNKAAKVFIDWNGDLDFDDSGEGVGYTPNTVSTNTYNVTFTVPIGTPNDSTRMRVVCAETSGSGDLLAACGSYGYGETEDYTVYVLAPGGCDLAAQSWNSPIANSSGLTASTPVSVTVVNVGTQSQSNYTVAYSINNGVSFVTETIAATLAAGTTYTHTFATNADFSASGNYSCIFQVGLACDANTVNNTVSLTVNNASQINTFPYVEYFTGATTSWTTGGASNTWQYGVPAGSIITSAASEPYCWVTNLTGNYNNYENSWVESPFINFTTLTSPILEMKLFYITENNYDGAAIEYSLDGGLTWTQMGYYQDPYGLNWYNNTYAYGSWPNIPKWSGASGGWITVKYKIYENPVLMAAFANQTVKFRVAFRADSSGYNEGIAFDNFSLYNAPEFDAELLTILNPYAQAVGNTAIDPSVIIKNQGTSTITSCTISYQIDGGAVTNYTYSGTIASTMTDTVTLPSFTTVASGNQSIKAWVSLTGDPLQSNDTLTSTFAILPYSCNYAMSFDGTNDWVEILDDTTLNSTDYTIEAWVKPSSFGWLKGIVSRYMPGGYGYVLRLSSTSPYTKVGFNEADANYTLSANNWYHLAAVNQNGVNTLYINGVAFAVAGTNLPNTSGKIAIGNDYMERWWNGLIDEVRLWKTALTATEINDWMYQPVTNLHPEWSNMSAYFNFDQPAGVAYDTRSNHDGIIHGAQFVASDLAFICEDNDAWLNAFVSPQGQSVEGNSLTPVVIVKNMGFNTINSLTVSYTVNGGAVNTYNYSGSIQTAMVDTLTLPSFVSGSGTNTITAWVTMANDANASNDTLETSFAALPVVCNYALDLPGTNQYAKLPAGQYFSNNFTVEAWVYKRANNYSSRLIDFGNGSNNNVLIQLNDGATSKVRFSIRQGTTEQAILSNTTIPLNQWVHIACSYDGVAGRIYINGVEDINGSIHNPLPVLRNDCYIGKSNWTGDGYANMLVDEFKFWNTTLLPATIQSYMNVPPSAGHPNFNMLNFYYDFNSPVENPVLPIFGGTSLNLIGGLYSTTSAPVVCDPYDAAITNIISPAGMVVENQLTEPIVLLTNLGVQNLTNAQIYYTFGIDTLTYTYTGVLYLGQTDTVALPGIMTPGGTTTTLCAWVEIPNDANSANDKTCRTYNIMLNACNYALYFDGSGDYVTIPVSPETEQLTNIYTLECWFKPEEFGFLDGLISKYQTSGGSGFQLRMGQTSPYTNINFDEQNAGPVLVANQWYHVAAVNNNGQHKLYVNGVEYLTSASATYNPNNTGIKFGVDYGDRWFKGYMDDVRIWKAALTQADVQAWMQHALTSSHPEYVNLVGHWEFDDLAPTATDSKANHHGLISNAVYKPSDAPVACGTQDAGVISFIAPGTTYFTGNYNALTVNVYNYGTDPITSLDMYYTVNNGTPVTYTYTGNIPSLGTQAITLPPFIGPAGTSATIMVSTDLAGDAVSFNDAKSKTVTATAPYEVALLNLAGPAGGCGLTDQEQLQFTIKNNGDSILSDLVVSYMSLPDSILHTELVTDTIMPLQQFVYTFNGTSDLYVGTGNDSTYSFTAWITLPGDAVTTNNSITFNIESVHASDSPTGTDTTVVFGSTATLHGYSPYTVYWFEDETGGTSINQGQNFTSPTLYDTTTYWIEASASMPYNITIGTGTSTSYYVPTNGWYNYSWSSSIYKAVDIGASMKITSIWYYVGNAPSNYTMNNQKIYMKHTTNNTQPNNLHPDFASMQSVYEGTIVWNGGGWKQIILTNPFNYNGIDNLEIGWQNYDGTYLTGYPTFRYTSVTSSSKYKYLDASYPATTGTITAYRPNVKFDGVTLGCPSERYPVTAYVTNIPQYDLSVDAILSPVSGFVLGNCETVTVNLTNWGAEDLSNFPIYLSMDNGFSTTEFFNGTLASGMSATFTFQGCVDLSAIDTFEICVNTAIPNDVFTSNDTICVTVINSPLSYCTSSALYTSYIEVVQFNIGTAWSNYSGPAYGAMYTDFTAIAPAELIIGQNVSTYLKPQHYSSSYDAFSNYKIYIDYNQDGIFDPVNEMAFGTNVWGQNGSYGQITIPQNATPGTTGMRLVFNRTDDPTAVSPCGTYSYGETEDYMITLVAPIQQDAGITEIIDPSGYMIQNGTETVKVRLQNFGSEPITSVDITYTIDGANPVVYTWTGNLLPFSNTLVNLQSITVPVMNFDFCAFTTLTGDGNSYNDTMCVTLFGNPQYQASLNTVSGIATGCNLGTTAINVNISNLADTIFPGMLTVSYQAVGMGSVVTEAINQTINPASSINYTFTTPFDQTVTSTTQITFNTWINLTNDPFTSNDSIQVVYYSAIPPAQPIVNNYTIFANEQAVVSAVNFDTVAIYNWYNEYMSFMSNNDIFTTPALTDTTLYQVMAVNPANMGGCASDITQFTVNVQYADYDGKITAIVDPTSGSFLTTSEPIAVTIYNNGLLPLSNFNVGFSINGGAAIIEPITATIAPGASLNYSFTGVANLFQNGYGANQDGYGVYDICAFTLVPNDGFTGNDTLCTSVTNMNGDGLTCGTSFPYGEINSPAVNSATITSYDDEWYSFTASTDYTNVAISLCGSSYDTYVSVWDSCGAATYFAYNDDYCGLQSQINLSTLAAGTYKVRVYGYSSNYGNFVLNITGTQVAPFTLDLATENVDCYNSSTGGIDLTVNNIWATGPFTYSWSNLSTTEDINNVVAGTYMVTVTDANGLTMTASATITQPDAIILTPAITAITSMGANTGAIDLTVTGGTAPFTFSWNTGATTEDLGSLYGGTYTLTISDANGCDLIESFEVTAPVPTGWTVTPTTNKHLVYVASVIPVLLDGSPIPYGSYIGLFYNQGTTPVCAGYFIWSGINTTMVAYGATSGLDNGFQIGEAFTWKLYEPFQLEQFNTTVTYSTSYPNLGTFVINGFSGLTSINAVSIITQLIHLPEGWSMWSTYVTPVNPNMISVISDIAQSGVPGIVTIVKNGAGNIYWPIYGINTIGNVQVSHGYQIKIVTSGLSGVDFHVTGLQITPEATPITIPQGWGIISYLRTTPANIVTMLAPVTAANCIAIVKNGAGNIYWPQYSLNTIGNMKPGEGYQTKSTCIPQTLTYPANTPGTKSEDFYPTQSSFYTPVKPTGNNMTLGIPVSAWDVVPAISDEVAVFNAAGEVCGTAVFEGEFMGITIWGDEIINPAEDKSTAFELVIQKFNHLTGMTETLIVTEWTEGDGIFATDKIAVASAITTIHDNNGSDLLGQNYPNPFTKSTVIPYYLNEDEFVTIKVFNQLGETIQVLVNEYRSAGSHSVEMNTQLPAGNYYYQMITNKVSETKSFSVN